MRPIPGTRFAALVGTAPFAGVHYCSYAPSAQAIADVTAAGMQVQADAEDAGVEVLALPGLRRADASALGVGGAGPPA